MLTTKSIYIQNKYHTWYHNIILNAQSQDRVKSNDTYYESHHIIPKSFGGTNKKSNLILLTAREHFICHALLVRFTTRQQKHKMIYAFNVMCITHQEKRQYSNSRLYESNRIEFSKLISNKMKGNKNGLGNKKNIGYKHTDKAKQNMSNAHKGRNNPIYCGDYHTPWGLFESSRLATTNLISYNAIQKWCNNPDKIITKISISKSKYLKQLSKSPLGKTFREIGFWFEPIKS